MLPISDTTMEALHEALMPDLRDRILRHWFESLNAAGMRAGETGREYVVDHVMAISRDDPQMTEADLAMAADFLLIQYVNDLRAQ